MYVCNPPQLEHFATNFGFFGFKNLKKICGSTKSPKPKGTELSGRSSFLKNLINSKREKYFISLSRKKLRPESFVDCSTKIDCLKKINNEKNLT